MKSFVKMMDNSNNIASSYIESNYTEIYENIVRNFVFDRDIAGDLLADVYMSIKKLEANGSGYDSSMGKHSDNIQVEEFIYSRIKLYAKNERYNKRMVKREVPASSTTDELSEMTPEQVKLAMASSYDNIDELEDKLDLLDNIEYLCSFEEVQGIKIVNLINSLSVLNNNLSKIDKSIFRGIQVFSNENPDFKEALIEVVKGYFRYPDLVIREVNVRANWVSKE